MPRTNTVTVTLEVDLLASELEADTEREVELAIIEQIEQSHYSLEHYEY